MDLDADVIMARFQLDQPFATARGSVRVLDRVFLRIGAGPHQGWGEAPANFPIDRFDALDLWVELTAAAAAIRAGRTPAALLDGFQFPAARGALDQAILDLEARQQGRSLAAILGQDRCAPTPGALWAIGFDSSEVVAREAARVSGAGFVPKLKLGRGVAHDLACVAAVANRDDVDRMALDANGAYGPADAELLIAGLIPFEACILQIEQPVAPEYGPTAMASLASRTSCVVVADESCFDADAAVLLASLGLGLNLKLAQLGGPTQCLALARGLDVPIMVGGSFGTAWLRGFDGLVLGSVQRPLASDAGMPAFAYFPGTDQRVAEARPGEAGLGLSLIRHRLDRLRIEDPVAAYRATRRRDALYQTITGRSWDWNLAP